MGKYTLVVFRTFPKPTVDIVVVKVPVLIIVVSVLAMVLRGGSVLLTTVPLAAVTVVLVDVPTTAVTAVDPLCTPTTLTLDVSTMLRRAHRLLMKLVTLVLLAKKSLIFISKWVVS